MAASENASLSAALAAIGGFESSPIVAVAVSGGTDSMALLRMAQHWTAQRQGRVIALTVDHGLRPESAQEAQLVAQWCAALGVEHHILKVQDSGFRIQGKIQESARQARYALLMEWCKVHHVLHLMTAHHRDDQAETLFFRLGRGSNIDGLACIPPVSYAHGVRLLRPLLSFSKFSLEGLLRDAGQPWIHDPTNDKPIYTRNRIRRVLRESPESERLLEQASRLTGQFGVIRHRLDQLLAENLPQSVSLFPEGYGFIHLTPFLRLPPELGLRALAALTTALNGAAYAPRTEKLQRLYNEIRICAFTRRSLAGLMVIAQPRDDRLLLCREPSATAGPVKLLPGEPILWDGRFKVACCGGDSALSVRALGKDGLRLLKSRMRLPGLPSLVMAGLPAFWSLEELMAVPHMRYVNIHGNPMECSACFIPARPLTAHTFSSRNLI